MVGCVHPDQGSPLFGGKISQVGAKSWRGPPVLSSWGKLHFMALADPRGEGIGTVAPNQTIF